LPRTLPSPNADGPSGKEQNEGEAGSGEKDPSKNANGPTNPPVPSRRKRRSPLAS
jgi:hypothetical protein